MITERTWARLGLALAFGGVAVIVALLALIAFEWNPKITIALLLGAVAALGVYVYDVRTEETSNDL